MRKILLILLLLVTFNQLSAQRIEYFGGVNKNYFYDFKNDTKLAYFLSEYEAGNGFQIGFSVEDIEIDSIPFRFTFSIVNYKGTLSLADGYLNGGSTSNFTSNKYLANIGIYPINKDLGQNFTLNLGTEISYLMVQSVVGNHLKYRINEGQEIIKMDSDYLKTKRNVYFGLGARLAYDIPLLNDWILVPQYSFYFGLTNEFKNVEAKSKAMRHFLSLGLSKIL